ncbi:hypothetical protein B4U37_02685 [Sutcliffiella horikoshii]|uniref:Uncharacterized protein n=1 Tax=Sutcliffiella horikoshii TaxID=79883 RepID=A0ABM6KFG5_9BACI|nr:hypothetical protein B4U37_02685 [Sutcliffiella horikoshii]
MDRLLHKVRAVPEKKSFLIGMTLILITPLLSFLIVDLFLMSNWIMIFVGVFINFFSLLFILNAADKRHSRLAKR